MIRLIRMHPVAALLLAGLVALAGLPVLVLLAGLVLSAPSRASVGPPPAALPTAEAVTISSGSGAVLRGWWVPGLPGRGAVVLMHGVRGNRLQLVERARLLAADGVAVLLFDFQAHGESGGSRITFGRLEGMDAAAAVRFARDHAPGERLGAVGISLGGAAALLGPGVLDVDALVLEAVYPTIDEALDDRLRAALGTVAGPVAVAVLSPQFKLLLPPILGVQPRELRPVDRIGEVRAPVLVAAGANDVHTTLAETHRLFAHVGSERELWIVPGAGHVDLQRFAPAEYGWVVLGFLERRLRRGS